ncbi:hypothetical protein ACLOJK_019762 [Asimina triloba]
MEEEDGVRARSFRYEDYNNRRAFLRSYPLHWEIDERTGDEEEEAEEKTSAAGRDRRMKKRILSIFQWRGGKIFLLRKLKTKVATFYLAACSPLGLNQTKSLLTR